ncbi:hypothetical protein IBX73_10340 [candidate division WOR-3 bacterium]|nr:hypothetical protein [candidate division WOR-3 bacterium]
MRLTIIFGLVVITIASCLADTNCKLLFTAKVSSKYPIYPYMPKLAIDEKGQFWVIKQADGKVYVYDSVGHERNKIDIKAVQDSLGEFDLFFLSQNHIWLTGSLLSTLPHSTLEQIFYQLDLTGKILNKVVLPRLAFPVSGWASDSLLFIFWRYTYSDLFINKPGYIITYRLTEYDLTKDSFVKITEIDFPEIYDGDAFVSKDSLYIAAQLFERTSWDPIETNRIIVIDFEGREIRRSGIKMPNEFTLLGLTCLGFDDLGRLIFTNIFSNDSTIIWVIDPDEGLKETIDMYPVFRKMNALPWVNLGEFGITAVLRDNKLYFGISTNKKEFHVISVDLGK